MRSNLYVFKEEDYEAVLRRVKNFIIDSVIIECPELLRVLGC